MKKNASILTFAFLAIGLFAKAGRGDKVDPFIQSQFNKDFGISVKATWEIIQGISIASYNEDGVEKHVYYYDDGTVLGIGKTINKAVLPAAICRAISDRFKSTIIETVYEFKSPGSPTRYYVRLVTPGYSQIVSASEFGELKVVKKVKQSN